MENARFLAAILLIASSSGIGKESLTKCRTLHLRAIPIGQRRSAAESKRDLQAIMSVEVSASWIGAGTNYGDKTQW